MRKEDDRASDHYELLETTLAAFVAQFMFMGEWDMRHVFGLGLIGVFGWLASASAQTAQTPPATPPAPAGPVETMPLELQDPSQFQVPTTLKPIRHVRLAAPVSGFVDKVEVKIGDVVRPGHIAVKLDDRRAKVRADTARDKIMLLEAKQPKTNDVELALVDAKAEQRFAELDLENTKVRAPFAGKILQVLVVDGQYVLAGEPLVALADPTVLVGIVPVSRETAKPKGQITLQVAGRRVQGEIAELMPLMGDMEKLSELDSVIAAYVTVANAEGEIHPGSGVKTTAVPEDPLARIPREAALVGGSGPFVRVVRAGRVRLAPISILGQSGRAMIQVSGDFRPGDRLIVRATGNLADGMIVEDAHPEEAGAARGATPAAAKAPSAPTIRRRE